MPESRSILSLNSLPNILLYPVTERLDTFEFLLCAGHFQKFDSGAFPIEIPLGADQMRFGQRKIFPGDCGFDADVGDPGIADAVYRGYGVVDAVFWDKLAGRKILVDSGEAQRTA